MLRSTLIVIGLLAIAAGVAVLATGAMNPSFVFIAWGVVLVAGIVFERFRYKPLVDAKPGPGWERTTERFVDEDSGKMVTVYVLPKTGERMYVRD